MKPTTAEWVAKAEGDYATLGREIAGVQIALDPNARASLGEGEQAALGGDGEAGVAVVLRQ